MSVVVPTGKGDRVRDRLPFEYDTQAPLPMSADRIPDRQEQDVTVTAKRVMDRDRRDEAWDALATYLSDISDDAAPDEVEAVIADDLGLDPETPTAEIRDVLTDPELPSLDREPAYLYDRATRPQPNGIELELEPHDEDGFLFWPGMYLALQYDNGEESLPTRVYSLANSPLDDHLELAIRRVEDGALTPHLCDDVEENDELHVRGPYMQGPDGEFLLDDTTENDIAFLATGTGDAPLKSMIDYIFQTPASVGGQSPDGGDRDIWLFLGAPWVDDLPHHGEYLALDEAHDRFHYVPTLSAEEYLTDWDGETDYVQHAFLKALDETAVDPDRVPHGLESFLDAEVPYGIDARIDPDRIDVYACGIKDMVYGMADTVTAIGVPAERVAEEGY